MDGQVVEQPIESRFERLLNPEPPKEEAKEEAAPEATEEVEVPEEAVEEKKPEIEVDPDVPFYKLNVKIEGGTEREETLSLKQLGEGFMRQADYQRKTAELARQREAVPLEVESKVKPVIEKYENNLRIFQSAVAKAFDAELGNVDWQKLAKEDPAQFVAYQARAQQLNQIMQSAQSELQSLENQKKEQTKKQRDTAVQTAIETLQRDVPNWSNELYSSILDTGVKSYGFKFEEIGEITDPRQIKVLHDAMQYQKLLEAKPAVEKKVAAVPKVAKPGSAEGSEKPNSQFAKAKQVLRKSGGKDLDAAADAFHALMQRNRK